MSSPDSATTRTQCLVGYDVDGPQRTQPSAPQRPLHVAVMRFSSLQLMSALQFAGIAVNAVDISGVCLYVDTDEHTNFDRFCFGYSVVIFFGSQTDSNMQLLRDIVQLPAHG